MKNQMLRIALLVLSGCVGTLGASSSFAATDMPASHSVLLNKQELADLGARRAAFSDLLSHCDRQLDYVAHPVAVLALAQHYTAKGVNTGSNTGKELTRDARAAYRGGLCFLLTHDQRYAASTQRILDAWAGTLKKVTTLQSKDNINFYVPYMIIAASWVHGAGHWNSTTFDRFLRTTVLPASNSANPNNHGAWGVFLEASIATYLGDTQLLERARHRWGTLLDGAVAADGTLTREIDRSATSNYHGGPDKGVKGLAYTHYFMLPATMAAKIFADDGRPVWATPEGKLFGRAFARAANWTLHPQTFPYYASNGGKLEGVRTAAYFVLLLPHYPNADAEAVLKQGDIKADAFYLLDLFGAGDAHPGRH
ncbi:MAG: hypothetical protein EPN68_09285 [Rhodanobacter sp.]|nr:MAG: hypothetical protein EPN68_09285 [Rhodanobacter sp.]